MNSRLRCSGWFFLICALWCALACGPVHAKQARPALEAYLTKLGYAAVPLLRGTDNHLMVKLAVAGKSRVFIVDTGCSITQVSTKLGSQFKTAAERGIEIKDAVLGTSTNNDYILIDEITLGQVRLLNEPAVVGAVNPSSVGASREGILGADFLVRHFCLIDCLDLRLYLRGEELSAQARSALEETLARGGLRRTTLEKTPGICRNCEVVINGEPVKLLVDTGGVYTVLDDATARRCHLKWGETQQMIAGVGKAGSASLYASRPESIKLAGEDLPLHGLYLCVADMQGWRLGEERDSHASGTFGADLLAADGCLIDLAGCQLWFVPQARK